MAKNHLQLEAYLKRVDFNGEIKVSLSVLEELHHAHLYSIPFENFDILLGRGIDLYPTTLFNKLVKQKRGGYCFELNGLFLEALKQFGFDTRALLARTQVTGKASGRGHQIELVRIGNKDWIVDVGFGGDTPRMPIPLILDEPITRNGQTVRLTDGGNYGIMLQAEKENGWNDLYSFDLNYVYPGDIEYGNYYNSTSPDIFFTFARVASLPIDDGGITLLDKTLTIRKNGKENVLTLEDNPTYLDALEKYFGIDLNVPYNRLKPFAQSVKQQSAGR